MDLTPTPFDAEDLQQHLGGMKRLAHRLLRGDASAAEDIAQQAAVRALERPPRAGTPLGPWLARVTRNLAFDRIRSERRRRRREEQHGDRRARATIAEPGAHAAPDVHVARAEAHRRLVDALLALPEPYRTSLVQHYLHGRAADAIAAELGCAPATVRSHWKRGLAMLREHLEREDGPGWRAHCALLLGVLPAAAGPSLLLFAATLVLALLHSLARPADDGAVPAYEDQMRVLYELGYTDARARDALGYSED